MTWLERLPAHWWNEHGCTFLSPECVNQLNIEILFLVRSLMFETRMYARTCKRVCLLAIDFQTALDARNIHRLISLNDNSRQSENSNISVRSLIKQEDALASEKHTLQLKVHWLAIDGEEPIVSENSLPNFLEEHYVDAKQEKLHDEKMMPSKLLNKSSALQKLFEMASSTKTK